MRVALTILVLLGAGCASLAIGLAPAKQPAEDERDLAQAVTRDFWAALHGGDYQRIDDLLERHKQAYLTFPYDPTIAAHIGFLHLWRVAESARQPGLRASVTDDLSMARVYFRTALGLRPDWALVQGFHASAILAEGAIHRDEKQIREGYFALEDAVARWPELNLFTKAIMLAQSPHHTPQYDEAVEALWRDLELCGGRPIDRDAPRLEPFLGPASDDPRKAICHNTWKAPYNVEGTMLVLGDLLVKQGRVDQARRAYAAATASPRFASWPHREALEARLAAAADNVEPFRRSMLEPGPGPRFITSSALACAVCHQKPLATAR